MEENHYKLWELQILFMVNNYTIAYISVKQQNWRTYKGDTLQI